MYLIFDTETTGLPKNYEAPLTDFDNWPRLVQIAWQLHDNTGKLISAKNFMVKPEGFLIPYNAQKVHGISTERALEEGKPLLEVLEAFRDDTKKSQIVIGHNIEFDVAIMGAEYLRNHLQNIFEGENALKTFCTKLQTVDFVALPGGKGGKFKWATLTELYFKLFNTTFADAHDAAYDVSATAKCFFGLLQQKVAKPLDETPPEKIIYEAPKLDEANFANILARQKKKEKVSKVSEGEVLPFVHLHLHSAYSILQSTASVKNIIKKAKELEMPAVAITDLGNLHGAFYAMQYGEEFGQKVILGCEVYVAKERRRLQFTKNEKDQRFQVVLLAKNHAGYKNLSKLVSLGYIEGFYAGVPRVDKGLIKEYKENLICLSGSLSGELAQIILNEGEDVAESALAWWIETFQDDFYLELNRHELEEENVVNEVLIKFAEKYDIKYIASNNVFYIDEKDSEAHDILLCVKDGEKKSTPIGRGRGTRFGFPNTQFYFKSQKEMTDLFADMPDALTNTILIAEQCESYKLKQKTMMPTYKIPEDFDTQDDYLKFLAYEGAKTRYENPLPQEVEERIDFELATIKNMGFPGYFLIVQDFINAAKDDGVIVGPGRGSAGGSVVAYCTGIINIDPIRYNLLFERFLNPERVSMPDIDIDFDDERRGDVIDYVVKKYGKNQVAQIITYGTMAARMAIKDVARVMELDLSESNRLAKLVPEKPGTKLKSAFSEIDELREIYAGRDERAKVLQNAEILEGSVRNTGIHAAGIIIAPKDLLDCIPVCIAKDAELFVTQFDGKIIEEAGMLKMDFLGLKTLTIIRDALRLIKENKGIDIDIDKIPIDDQKTYELYQRGETNGTFQFESEGMQMYLRQLKPTDIEDLIAMNALYRPGPIEFIPKYIERKHGREPVEYPHPALETLLKPTFGIMVYQEQIMQTAQVLAGYTLGGADLLRRAMGKKKKEEMDKQRSIFVEGAFKTHNVDADKANEVFNVMEFFAGYGFNRSHSAAYSVVAYQTAYLKANYPAEYMASVLTHNMNNIEKITFFLEECQRMQVKVLGPDVNESKAKFSVNKADEVRFGLSAIKGTGDAAIDSIIKERQEKGNFKSVFDFAKRVNLRTVNKKSFESLGASGAFDSFEFDRRNFFGHYKKDKTPFLEKLLKYGQACQKDKENGGESLFGGQASDQIAPPHLPDDLPEWGKLDMLNKEKEVVGVYISGHPLDQYKLAMSGFRLCHLDRFQEMEGKDIKIAGIITHKTEKTYKNGTFITFNIEDYHGTLEIALFGRDKDVHADSIEPQKVYMISGKVQKNYKGERLELKISKIEDFDDLKAKPVQSVELFFSVNKLNPNFIQQLQDLFVRYEGNLQVKICVFEPEKGLRTELKTGKGRLKQDEKLFAELEKMGVTATMIY